MCLGSKLFFFFLSFFLFWDSGLGLCSRTILSWTLIISKNILSRICSRSIIWMHTASGAYLLYAPRAVCILIWSWSIFDLKYSSRLLMVQVHMVLEHMVKGQLVLDHILRPKSPKSDSQAHSLIHNYFATKFVKCFDYSMLLLLL